MALATFLIDLQDSNVAKAFPKFNIIRQLKLTAIELAESNKQKNQTALIRVLIINLREKGHNSFNDYKHADDLPNDVLHDVCNLCRYR